MRITVAGMAWVAWAGVIAAVTQTGAPSYHLNIPQEPLDEALQDLARQTGKQIARFSDTPTGTVLVGPLSGEMSIDEAFHSLLAQTGLTYEIVNERMIAVMASDSDSARQPPGESSMQRGRETSDSVGASQSDRRAPARSPATRSTTSLDSNALSMEQVVVTAQKQSERLLDVPLSVTVLEGDQLLHTQAFRFEDYTRDSGAVPGLTFLGGAYGEGSELVIRSITTGILPVNNSVATYVDETPYVLPGRLNAKAGSPDFDTFDMQRIEVLKGPQGTLYGANALAGLLKYVTNLPDPAAFAVTIETGISSVSHGGSGFDTHAMVNLPLTRDMALRLVGYDNDYPGFIDDPSRGVTNINGNRLSGGRAALLYQPTEGVSIRLNALYQTRRWSDWNDVDVNPRTLQPIYGGFTHETLVDQPGYVINQVYNLTLDWDFVFAKLLSTTSYSQANPYSAEDLSLILGPSVSRHFGQSLGDFSSDYRPGRVWTEEIRLTSSGNRSVRWQAGMFTTWVTSSESVRGYPISAATRSILYDFPTTLLFVNMPETYKEYAAFANLDYDLMPQVDINFGGRYSSIHEWLHQVGYGLQEGNQDFSYTSSQNVSTYSANLRWHVTPDRMLYARVASGYSPGGPNAFSVANAGAATSYNASTAVNYEVGIKSRWLDKDLVADFSIFDIEWRNIQLIGLIDGVASLTNGGAARSAGAEWNMTYEPIGGLTLGLNGAYNDAYLTDATPAYVGGRVGDRLPGSALWESAVSAEYRHSLYGRYTGFAGVSSQYLGSRYANFEPKGPRPKMAGFAILDLRAGVETAKTSLTFYVKNATDKFAINYLVDETLANGLGQQAAFVCPPRTIGLTMTLRF